MVGGAFYDLASQCITPLVGGRGSVGLNSNSSMGRRAGSNAPAVRGRELEVRGLEQQRKSRRAFDVVDARVAVLCVFVCVCMCVLSTCGFELVE